MTKLSDQEKRDKRNQYMKTYYINNKSKIQEYNKSREKNRDRKSYKLEWVKKNKNKIRAYDKKSRELNKYSKILASIKYAKQN